MYQLLGLLLVSCVMTDASVIKYRRLMQMATVRTGPPPVFSSLIDIVHERMLSLPFFDQEDADQLDIDTYDHYLTKYGLDFSLAIYNATTGISTLVIDGVPTAIIAPYGINQDEKYRLVSDSKHKQREKQGTWITLEFGNIVQMLKSGNFTAGNQGSYVFGDLLVAGKYVFLDSDDDITKPKNREVMSLFGRGTGKSFVNSWGFVENTFKVDVHDGVGYGRNMVVTQTDKELDGSLTRYVSNTIVFA